MLKNKDFAKDGIIEIMQSAKKYTSPDFEDLFDDMFDYCEAPDALETFKNNEKLDGYDTKHDGVLGAIELVKQYELDQFGEITTLLEADLEEVAGMVEYIRGETLFKKVLRNSGLNPASETTEENIQKFMEATKKL